MSANYSKYHDKMCRVCMLPADDASVKFLIEGQVEDEAGISKAARLFQKLIFKFDQEVDVSNKLNFYVMVCQKDLARLKTALNLIRRILNAEDYYFQPIRDKFHGCFRYDACRVCCSFQELGEHFINLKNENLTFFQSIVKLQSPSNWINYESMLMCKTCLEDLIAVRGLNKDVDICDKFVTNNNNQKRSVYDSSRPFECSCSKTFKLKHHFSRHQRTCSRNKQSAKNNEDDNIVKRVSCSICGKIFQSKYLLRIHIEAVHLKIKNYSCDLCHEKFYFKDHMKRHIIGVHINKDKRNFKCDFVGCECTA